MNKTNKDDGGYYLQAAICQAIASSKRIPYSEVKEKYEELQSWDKLLNELSFETKNGQN